MKHIAHIKDGKIVNISLHKEMPKGQNFLDVSETPAKIGDEIHKGQVIPAEAFQSLDEAKEACRNIEKMKHMNDRLIDGFKVSSLTELMAIYNCTDVSLVITLSDDTGLIRHLDRHQMNDLLNRLAAERQLRMTAYNEKLCAIEDLKSIKDLIKLYSDLVVHPKAK
jgi:hypothetical protein